MSTTNNSATANSGASTAQPSGNVNASIEILDNEQVGNGKKKILCTVNVTLTADDYQELKDAYESSRIEEELVMDRMFNDNVNNAIETQFGGDNYEIGDTTITDANGTVEVIKNPWI